MKNLVDFFEEKIAVFGPRLAIQMRPRYRTIRWTYSDLGAKTSSLARALERRDVQPGDRVLLYSPNSPYWVAAFFAILRCGGVVVPLNPQSPPEQLDRIVDKVKPKLLMKSLRHPWMAQSLPALEIEAANEVAADFPGKKPALSTGSLAEIIFTSGTTGDPKGVMLTHANLFSNFEALSHAIATPMNAHILNLVPLYHVYAQLISMILPLGHGVAVTHIPSFSSRVIRETLATTPATHLVAVPEFLKTVMDRIEARFAQRRLPALWKSPATWHLPFFLRRALFASVRRRISKTLHTIACGGAKLDAELEYKWRALGFHVLQGYGLTETGAVLSANTYQEHRAGTVGKPLPGVEVKLSSDGEIWVRGPNVMPGYYEDPERTREAFEEGWFKTDDGGSLDPDGFIRVFGRRKYLILGPSGENVFPEDIEAELGKIPGVEDSAVVGLETAGRVVIHAVLLGDIRDGDAVVAEANRHLAPHQQIMQWSVWPQADFPRSATRKVRKEDVIEWLKSVVQEKTAIPPAAQTPLTRILAQVTERDPRLIHPQTRIVPELSLDSLLRIELVSRIEEEFEVMIEERRITPQTTVAELEALLLERQKKPAAPMPFPSWTLRFPVQVLRRLFQWLVCFSWTLPYVRLRRTGLENLKELRGPVLFMPNHRSYLDSLVALWGIPRRFRRRLAIAAAIDPLYKKFPRLGHATDVFMNTYPFATEAEENIKPSLEFTGRLVDKGWNILIFPEGRINRTDQTIMPLKGGAGVVAVEMQIPVVPMAIRGSAELVPPGEMWFVRRGKVEVCFGKPLRFTSLTPYSDATRAIEHELLKLVK